MLSKSQIRQGDWSLSLKRHRRHRNVRCLQNHLSCSSIYIAEPAPELTHTKLVVSIQHKPSAQHAQFSAKPQTRIGKVLAGACKSFRLDVNVSVLPTFALSVPRLIFSLCRAQLYLVVVTQNDEGLKEEDHFLCDRNETVETAIVGVEGRANFMIRMPEDPAM